VKILVKTVIAWARNLALISLAFAFIEMLLPDNNLQRFIRVIIGIVMVAVIIGFISDLPVEIDQVMESTAAYRASPAYSGNDQDLVTKGQLVADRGLEIAAHDTGKRIAGQLESIAKWASGANEACAEIEFTPSGDFKRIHITLGNINTPLSKTTPGGNSRGETDMACSHNDGHPRIKVRQVKDAIYEFYRLSEDVEISVSVGSR
jgi:stage III sporulation protein AF